MPEKKKDAVWLVATDPEHLAGVLPNRASARGPSAVRSSSPALSRKVSPVIGAHNVLLS